MYGRIACGVLAGSAAIVAVAVVAKKIKVGIAAAQKEINDTAWTVRMADVEATIQRALRKKHSATTDLYKQGRAEQLRQMAKDAAALQDVEAFTKVRELAFEFEIKGI